MVMYCELTINCLWMSDFVAVSSLRFRARRSSHIFRMRNSKLDCHCHCRIAVSLQTFGLTMQSLHCRYLYRVFALLLSILLVADYITLRSGLQFFMISSVGQTKNSSNKDRLEGNGNGSQLEYNTSHLNISVLCWVLTSPENHESRAAHVKKTWGKRCTKLLFMSTQADEDLGAIALEGVEEGRDWLWAKTKASLRYVWQNHRDDADWFIKADDDTYVVMENLRYFLQDYNSTLPYYMGCRLQYVDIKESVNFGGAGYLLSREALRRFVEQALPDANKCNQSHFGDEDTELGICLANIGIEPADTRDRLGRHRFLHSYPQYHFSLLEEKWGDVRDPEEPGLACCSDGLISFHKQSIEDMYTFEFMIYHFKLYDSARTSGRV